MRPRAVAVRVREHAKRPLVVAVPMLAVEET
jgi:hypothetical protein